MEGKQEGRKEGKRKKGKEKKRETKRKVIFIEYSCVQTSLLLLGFDLKPSNSFEKSNQAKTHEHVK
jgi:hypothetical protein